MKGTWWQPVPLGVGRRGWRTGVWVMVLILVSACGPSVKPPITVEKALVRLAPEEFPVFSDDMDPASLKPALDQSVAYLRQLDPSTACRFGPDAYTSAHLIDSLEAFYRLVEGAPSSERLNRAIRDGFHVYRSVGSDREGKVLFTGYYEPVLRGSRQESADYPYPLYRCPDDLVIVDLSRFDGQYGTDRLVGRQTGRTIVPYFERKEIDSQGCLDDRGYELLWISNRIDLFFLQIQGSGRVVLTDGTMLHVNYACRNGRPYRSIGRLLIDEEKISEEEMSAQRIRAYLRDHPDEMERIFNHNASYVFFRLVDSGPLGALEVPLTPGRSMATDLSLFPRGALAFIETEKPVVGGHDRVDSWEPLTRFVLNQDTGGAIRGPGRVDCFWGSGDYARTAAGYMRQEGRLYFIVKKQGKD